MYYNALKDSGYTEKISYTNNPQATRKRTRQRNIIWFNPPFSSNVRTSIGGIFLKLIRKHFPKKSTLHKIFNQNTMKVSYSCMPNVANIIKTHNNKIANNNTTTKEKSCNCRNKSTCPLQESCLTTSIIYNAEVKREECNQPPKLYIGLTEHAFKQRYNNHNLTFRHEKYANSTELSKYIWQLKRNKKTFKVDWSISQRARPYSNETKRCDLCLTEKLCILNADKQTLLNKKSELISKCRHENKFYIANFKSNIT